METPTPAVSPDAVEIPTPEIPNAARIYNYTLGGPYNTPADQGAAQYMFSLVPSTQKWVRMLRDFVQEAAAQLWNEGFTHFIDFAAGIPDQDHIHHILPAEARIIYSDIDPYTYALAQKLVAGHTNVLYLQADINNAKAFLNSPEVSDFLGGERRVAFGLNGITAFLSPDEIRTLFTDLYEWAAPGSKAYITYETKDPSRTTPQMEQFTDMFRQAGSPFWLYSLEECIELSAPWALPEEGLVPVAQFLEHPEGYMKEEDYEEVGLEFYAAILEKPV